MKLWRKILNVHDALLARELRHPKYPLAPALFLSGLLAITVGWLLEENIPNKMLLAAGGFALGLAAEKFANIQIKRIYEEQKNHEQSE